MKTIIPRPHFLIFLMIVALFMSVAAAPANGGTAALRLNTKNLSSHAAPMIGSCPLFLANNYWNTPVDTLPVHALSAAWVNSIGATRRFHMDFGSGTWDGGPIGIPFNVISGASATKYAM